MKTSSTLLIGSCIAASLVYADTTTPSEKWGQAGVYADQWGGCSPYRIAPDHAFYFTGAALWWEGSNVDLVAGFHEKTKERKRKVNGDLRTILLKPEFNWGFRVGVGYQMPFDDWELALDWTRIHEQFNARERSKHHEHLRLDLEDADLSPKSIHGHARIKIDYLDLALRREFLVTRFLGLKPQVGLRSLWLREHNHIDYSVKRENPHFKTKNNFWGIGPKFGLDTRWMLGWGFSIYGDMSLDLLYGRFKLENKVNTDQKKHHIEAELESSPRTILPMTDLSLGLQWDRLYSDNNYHLNFFIGWEHHVFFQAGQTDVAQVADRNNANFTTSGLTFGGRFDF